MLKIKDLESNIERSNNENVVARQALIDKNSELKKEIERISGGTVKNEPQS